MAINPNFVCLFSISFLFLGCVTNMTEQQYRDRYSEDQVKILVDENYKKLAYRLKQQFKKCFSETVNQGQGMTNKVRYKTITEKLSDKEISVKVAYDFVSDGSFGIRSEFSNYALIVDVSKNSQTSSTASITCNKAKSCKIVKTWIERITAGCPQNFSPM